MPLEESPQNDQTMENMKRTNDNEDERALMPRGTVEELILQKIRLSSQKYGEQKELCGTFRRLKRRLQEIESDKMAGKCRSQICVWRGR